MLHQQRLQHRAQQRVCPREDNYNCLQQWWPPQSLIQQFLIQGRGSASNSIGPSSKPALQTWRALNCIWATSTRAFSGAPETAASRSATAPLWRQRRPPQRCWARCSRGCGQGCCVVWAGGTVQPRHAGDRQHVQGQQHTPVGVAAQGGCEVGGCACAPPAGQLGCDHARPAPCPSQR